MKNCICNSDSSNGPRALNFKDETKPTKTENKLKASKSGKHNAAEEEKGNKEEEKTNDKPHNPLPGD